MNTVEMNFDVRLYEDEDTSISFHGIVTPTYDAVYDVYPHYFGDRAQGGAAPGSQTDGERAARDERREVPGTRHVHPRWLL